MLQIHRTDATHLGVDPKQRFSCAEKECTHVGPVGTMEVWSLYRPTNDVWKHYAFCGREHALACLPASAMGKA